MVICAIFNCHNRSDRDKNVSFYRLPTITHHQGPQELELSTERQQEWLAEESAALLLNEGSFSSSDDEKVLYYTGLSSWELFSKLFTCTFVKPHLKQKSSLSPFQQLLMTLRDCA